MASRLAIQCAVHKRVNGGESGYFERGLNVYGRAGLPCKRCGAAIVREPFMNRSPYRCPKCQRAPQGFRPLA
ncbi:zinc finger domain-containing protein [Kocuria massiliensis]|uniref:zinc finger domain-containing protein n=1 Tax=Kocuria massiliensis TaxID=1926282 RepID=UPI003CCBF4C5